MVSLLLTFWILFYLEFLFPGVLAQSDFDWSTVEPTSNLSWVDCYSDYQCTRFQVPIDYSNEDSGQAAIAVIKFPAQSETEYKGTILINPGGPGLSGVSALSSFGPLAVSVFGNQYDIVSFDPRGVGNSTPRAQFFLSTEEQYQWLSSTNNWAAVVNTSSDQIPHLWASAQVLAELAQEGDNGILNYISTDNVARDMLRISQAAGQEKLQYYGDSYGTVLGFTFAAMFPDKVGRMVLDGVQNVLNSSRAQAHLITLSGVVDADAYYSGDWSNTTVDADKVMQSFFEGCVAAGADACAFYASTAEEISNNLDFLYESLLIQPVPVVSPPFYGVVDYTALRTAVWNAVCAPYQLFSLLAEGLASLADGNGTIIFEIQASVYDPSSGYDNTWDAGIAVACGDAANYTDSVADLFAYAHDVEALSTFSNSQIIMQRIRCEGWKFHRGDIFTGPIAGNTSYPILFIGNTADPITPLSAAFKLSTAFPGSVVLTQNSSGHTSISASSECTDAYVQAYFQNGTLPKDGTVCEVESEMFPASSDAIGAQ
ncbi:TAP-like protein-domain-containing protein [Armillaria luteobubalina]|uniref:TAP-like protein-domain-containing protein n=1 Tax=Armillaria luteobubalina TaxID=153913 RepID=A0AA39QK98_9AGAR|nr:TAP-like protein-domain-containing protein [Armillaria luteobubalina]